MAHKGQRSRKLTFNVLRGKLCSPSWTWLGHRSLVDTSFTETLTGDERERMIREGKVDIWSVQGAVAFGEEKERR